MKDWVKKCVMCGSTGEVKFIGNKTIEYRGCIHLKTDVEDMVRNSKERKLRISKQQQKYII